MIEDRWLTWTLVAVLGWGLWGAFAAETEKHGGSAVTVTAGVALVEALMFIPAWPRLAEGASWWTLATGLAGGAAYLAMFMALKGGGPGPAVIGVTSTYPIVTLLIGVLVTGETLTFQQMLGIVVAVAGVVLISTGG
jgi:transporter family protein